MDPVTLQQYADLVSTVGIVALLFFLGWAGHRQHWNYGWQFKAMTEDRDFYRKLALEKIAALEAITVEYAKITAELAKRIAEGPRA